MNVEVRYSEYAIQRGWKLEYANDYAAGMDLRACISEPVRLIPQAPATLIPTGVFVHMKDPNMAAIVLPRSGLGHKKGLVMGNGTGLIDADYQGEMFVSAWNRNPDHKIRFSADDIIINPGDRIAQLVFLPIIRASLCEVFEFTAATERGAGGFGSTGVA